MSLLSLNSSDPHHLIVMGRSLGKRNTTQMPHLSLPRATQASNLPTKLGKSLPQRLRHCSPGRSARKGVSLPVRCERTWEKVRTDLRCRE